ncbi:MAG: alpha/beta hydrolase [Nitrospira sp.]|nr:alpha/beta hydrolase [Nitrospira sp.]MDH4303320.1 alpha/beta hydrolase [Nitrospira sp.]
MDPALSPLTGWSWGNVSANQLSFRVAMAGTGDQLVLCLHGFPESSISWRYQFQPLAQAGYRVWAPDLRGYGGTTRPIGLEPYSIESLLEDVSGLLTAAGTSQAVLVGHDWGGIIAWYYALRHPDRVKALVILNAPHPACFEREIRHWRQLHRSWYMGMFQIPWLPEAILSMSQGYMIEKIFERMTIHREYMPDEIVEVYRQQACAPGALTAMLNYYRAALRGGGALRQRTLGYPTIDIPTLVIWGLQDHALGAHNLDELNRVVSNLTVVTLADAGHFVHEDHPDHVTTQLITWLESTLPR